ncbi:hypothetical protein D9M68_827100 [compost metagenome]
MRIAHGHRQRGVAQDPLQREDVAAVHHEVRREGVAQYMALLTSRQIEAGHLHREVEAVAAVAEQAVALEVFLDAVLQGRIDGH